jgi:hypothetical protein
MWLVRRLGNVGVALGTLVPVVALQYWFLKFALSELHVGWREFLNRAVWPPATAAAVSYLPLVVTYSWVPPDSPTLALVAVACSAVYLLVVWRFLDEDERGALAERVSSTLRLRHRSELPSATLSVRPDRPL